MASDTGRVMNVPKQAAAQARSHPAVRSAARAGFVANGAVHVLIGLLALVMASGRHAQGDQGGALAAIAGVPLGFAVLWVVAVALWALALWNLLDGIVVFAGSDVKQQAKKWGRRLSSWAKAVAYAGVGLLAASAALGARSDGNESARSASRDVLAIPGGPVVLGLIGLGVAVAGIAFGVMGVRRTFEKKMDLPDGPTGTAMRSLGVAGYLAKGVALLVVGILLLVAAVKVDPGQAGGTDAALRALLATPFGPWSVGAVGVGLIAYGMFLCLRARYERL